MSATDTDIREDRRIKHENSRRRLSLRSYPYASVAEVDESWECNGVCRASYKGTPKVRVVIPAGSCGVHWGGS